MAASPDLNLSDGDTGGRPAPSRRSEPTMRFPPPRPPRRRGVFSLAWLRATAKTLMWLAPTTAGIWVYAEREQTDHSAYPVRVAVQVTTSAPNRYVEVADGPRVPTVNLKLSGPHTGVQAVTQTLTAHGLTVDLGSTREPGRDRVVSVIEAIQAQPLFKDAGVSIDESVPADLHVNVDQVVERPAEVEADARVPNLSGPGTFDPPRVMLRGPKAQLDDLAAFEKRTDGKLRVTADLAKFADQLRSPGDVTLTGVPLVMPVAEDQVAYRPTTVSAKLQVRAADESYTIDGVPVVVEASPGMLQKFDVAVSDPSVSFVHVTGPPAQIQAIRDKQVTVTADLQVTPADAGAGDQQRTVSYAGHLPPGVTVSGDDLGKTVTFKVTRRD